MARDLDVARGAVELSEVAIELLQSVARPIVIGRAVKPLTDVAPDNRDYGVMLPYARCITCCLPPAHRHCWS